MKSELLQPAATLAAAMMVSHGEGARELSPAEITNYFIKAYAAIEAAALQVQQKPPEFRVRT